MHAWYLESYLPDGSLHSKQQIRQSPCIIGRAEESTLVLASEDVSRRHAELELQHGQPVLRDLNSTNGTFVNRQRVQSEELLRHGDVVHFANMEFRVMCSDEDTLIPELHDNDSTLMLNASLSGQLPTGAREFQELLTTRQVCPHYQPIVATNGELYGYELLGRGAHSALPVSPGPLFQLAESLGLAVELSELFRYEGVRLAANAGCTRLFMNIHPAELTDLTRLMHSLQQLKSLRGSMELLLEIHEHCVTGLPLMSRIKEGVEALGIHLAYDDFGAGQARLVELVDAPPTVLKFDISLVRGVANASQKRQQMLRMLIGFCQEQGILSLAECLEDEADVAVCRKLGFDLMQGFYFSVPKPVQSMAQ